MNQVLLRSLVRTIVFVAAFPPALAAEEDAPSALEALIPWLLTDDTSFKEVPFADVIAATCGKKILPWTVEDPDNQRILAHITLAMNRVLAELNQPTHPAGSVRRINEASSFFENAMRETLNARPEFTCDFPHTAAGHVQRSGYPDLRLVDRMTRRVYYLDPKLYAKGSRASTFRTFYFEPKRATNKILDDAFHFIVGVEHDPDAPTRKFLRWELIDLSRLRVRLKAEFEASNRDLYQSGAVVGSGPEE